MNILTVVGARPQFIKASSLSRAIAATSGSDIRETIVHTGQHFDKEMSAVFFDELCIPAPALNLGIPGGRHGEATGAMLAALEEVMIDRQPDMVVVYGDTNSTLAGALAASKLHIPVAHVEAGMRSFNRAMPEEINRVLTDHVSALLFCPSEVARDNLAREGIADGVHITGDVMYDAVLYYKERAPKPTVAKPYALATVHRAENTDTRERLAAILDGLGDASVPVLLPLHPRTRRALDDHGLALPDKIRAIDPVSYLEMIGLVTEADYVLTDSGGLQKEAYYLGKRCVTLRAETEWTELVDLGVNRLVDADPKAIREAMSWAAAPADAQTPVYGDGQSAQHILRLLEEFLRI